MQSVDSLSLSMGNSSLYPGGTSILGGLDLISSLEAKFGTRSGQVQQIRGKTWEVLLPQVKSEIQRAKFGVLVTCIFGGKIWGSNKNL